MNHQQLRELLKLVQWHGGVLSPDVRTKVQAVVDALQQADLEDPFLVSTAMQIVEHAWVDDQAHLVAQYLHHPHEFVRCTAVSVLGSWQALNTEAEIRRLIGEDPEGSVRQMATLALGNVYMSTRNIPILRDLLCLAEDADEDLFVRTAAYSSMLRVWDYELWRRAALSVEEADDFDPVFLQQIREHVSQ